MGSRPLTPLGQQFMDSLPPVLRNSSSYEACMHALARELELLEVSIEVVRAQFNPASATVLLPAWEYILRLPGGGAGGTYAQRQLAVVARLRKLLGSSEGREWESRMSEILGQAWSYEENIPGDSTSPPAGTLRISVPFNPTLPQYNESLREIREITPAHLALTYVSSSGFFLDYAQWDVTPFVY